MAKKKIIKKQTWYGLEANIEINTGIFHKAGLGSVVIPHPPVINYLIRVGLNKSEFDSLSLIHEFGHLQTFPFILFYSIIIFYLYIINGLVSGEEIVFLLISIHSLWEIMSESYTILTSHNSYKIYYQEVSLIPRIIFWLVTITLSAGAWILLHV